MPVIAVMWFAPSETFSGTVFLLNSSLNLVMVRFLSLGWMGGVTGPEASNRNPWSMRSGGLESNLKDMAVASLQRLLHHQTRRVAPPVI